MRCVIVDIDGTLTDNKHRAHHLQKQPKDWDAFDAEMDKDGPVWPVIELVKCLAVKWPIILCSGRKESHRALTLSWLRRFGVSFSQLYMRASDDFRPDFIVKSELLDKILEDRWEPLFVIDDRKSVVQMWRSRGLVCLQAQEGDS